jgi:ABC-type glycerol-3-phosphate transport system permease component
VLILTFLYYPAASGIYHSFYRWNGADISEYRGLGNYIELLTATDFWNSFRNAFIIGAWNIIKMVPALLVAVCIHRCGSARMRHLYRTLFIVPMVIPPLVTVLIWRSLFFEASSGLLNRALMASGIHTALVWMDGVFGWGGVFQPGRAPAWLGDPNLLMAAVVIWGFPWVGSFAILTHLSKLGGINASVYEAAKIDGAGWWGMFRQIELPLVMGSVYVNLVFVIIGTIKDAGTIMLLAGFEGGPGGAVTVPALFMLRKAFLEVRMGYACAIGVILMLVVMGLQKMTNIWIEWDDLSPRRRFVSRLWFMAGAVLIFGLRTVNPGIGAFLPFAYALLYLVWPRRATLMALAVLALAMHGQSPVLRVVLVAVILCALPWARLGGMLPLSMKEAAGRWRERHDARRTGAAIRREQAGATRALASTAGDLLLRGSKHAAIWALLALALLPVWLMFVVSFKSNPQFYTEPVAITRPLHLENWARAWETIAPSVANSMYVCTTASVASLVLALAAAYFFARLRMPLSGLLWNGLMILMMYPAIASMVPLFRLISSMGLLNTLTAVIIVSIANGLVFAVFVLRNFISDVPQDLFDAAEIDGAGHFRQMWTIVRPLSGPILGTVGIMIFTGLWNDFILPLILLRDAEKLTVIVQLMRLAGEYIKYWGPMMAGYVIASVPVVILFIFSMKLFIRGITEGAIKD